MNETDALNTLISWLNSRAKWRPFVYDILHVEDQVAARILFENAPELIALAREALAMREAQEQLRQQLLQDAHNSMGYAQPGADPARLGDGSGETGNNENQD